MMMKLTNTNNSFIDFQPNGNGESILSYELIQITVL